MQKALDIIIGAAVEIFLLAVAAAVVYRIGNWFSVMPKRQIVQGFQRGVVFRDGRAEKVLNPGAYWISPKRTLLLCDVRPIPFQLLGQELLTADGVAVRVSLGGEYFVKDPTLFVAQSSDAFGAFYLELRQAMRLAIAELTSDELLSADAQVPSRAKELLVPKGAQLGIELSSLELVEMMPIGRLRPV